MSEGNQSVSQAIDRFGPMFELNNGFAQLKPLLAQTRWLALNAEIAAAHLGKAGESFAMVAREVILMGSQLQETVSEIETAFHHSSHAAAQIMGSNWRREFFLRANAAAKALHQEGEAASQDFREEAMAALTGCAASQAASRQEKAVEMARQMTGLTGLLSRLNIIATRKSNYLAISAKLESALFGAEGEALRTVSAELGQLSKEFSALEKTTENRVGVARAKARAMAGL